LVEPLDTRLEKDVNVLDPVATHIRYVETQSLLQPKRDH
jgi:hypothetical protein